MTKYNVLPTQIIDASDLRACTSRTLIELLAKILIPKTRNIISGMILIVTQVG